MATSPAHADTLVEVMQFLSRASDYLREHGWRVGFALAAHRALGHLGAHYGLYWYRFYRQPLQGAPSLRANTSIEFSWLPGYEERLASLPRPVAKLQARFEQDVQCLIATKEGELRACAWFGFNRFEEDEVRCTFILPRHAVWDFDIYVFPKYRIGRLFVRIWQEANRKLAAEGYTESFSRISVYNSNSIRSHEKMGAQKAGGALFLKLGRVQMMLASPSPRISFSVQRRPDIDFRRLRHS